jgi:hypothetical protein
MGFDQVKAGSEETATAGGRVDSEATHGLSKIVIVPAPDVGVKASPNIYLYYRVFPFEMLGHGGPGDGMTLTVRYRLPRPAWTADSGPGSPHVAPGAVRTGNSPTGPKVMRLARQLALAYEIDRLIEDGALTYAEAAKRLGVSRARITQIANLRWLPVAVQERILAGEIDGSERDLRTTWLSD